MCGGRVGSECKGARVGIGGDGVCAGDGAGVIDATLLSPSRESSLSRTMPSADEAMVEDGRGRLQAYRPATARQAYVLKLIHASQASC